jgi:hypothetical protein
VRTATLGYGTVTTRRGALALRDADEDADVEDSSREKFALFTWIGEVSLIRLDSDII